MSLSQPSDEPKQASKYSGEIKDLLLAAQNQFFDDDEEVVREKDDFEKIDSFFELVQKGSDISSDDPSEIEAEQEMLASEQSLENLSEGSGDIDQDQEVAETSRDTENEVLADSVITGPEADSLHAETLDENTISEDLQANAEIGIAEEPFCLSEKNSSTSPSSLLCKCLISIAKFSSDDAIIAITEKRYAYLSLGITCVETSSERIFNFFAT